MYKYGYSSQTRQEQVNQQQHESKIKSVLIQQKQVNVINNNITNKKNSNKKSNHPNMSKSQQELLFQSNKNNTNSNVIEQHIAKLNQHQRSRSRKFSKYVNNSDPTPLVAKAKQLYQFGQLKQALFYFEEALKIFVAANHHQGKNVPMDAHNYKFVYLDGLYYAAEICMALGDYHKAEAYFRKLNKTENKNYRDNSILLFAICLSKIGKGQQSMNHLNQLCDEVKSVDALFYRGKLKLKNGEYKQSSNDFEKIAEQLGVKTVPVKLYLIQSKLYTNPNQNELEKLLSIANSTMQELKIEQNEKQKENIKKLNDNIKKCRNLKAQILIGLSKINEAEQQIDTNLLQPNGLNIKRDSETLFLKAKVLDLKGKLDQQILFLNQCVTIKDHRRSVMYALQTLVINSMKQKDFYEAFQYSKRNNFLKIQNKSTTNLFKIAQAITFLMKKKYGEALLLIGAIDPQIYKDLKGNHEFIKNLHYSALGYAYFSLGQHKDALKMYKKIQVNEQNPEHFPYLYNRRLCQGILAYKQNKIEQSIKIFESSTDYLMRSQPYLYISVILMQKSFVGNTDPDLISKVIQIIDSGLKVGENYQMYYYRSLLYFSLGMNVEALDDVDRAVQKSQENVAKFFYLRGLIFFNERNYENAISQLTTCLSIDDKYYDAYLERAKLKLLTEQVEDAFEDLANHPLCQEWRPLFLLYQNQYTTILNEKLGNQQVIQIANFQLGRFQEAGPAGKIITAVVEQNYEQISKFIQDVIDITFQLGCLSVDDLYLIRAYCSFKLGNTSQTILMLQKSEEMLKKNENYLAYGEEDEKKLLAIKVNIIFTYLMANQIQKSYEQCQKLISDVYEGIVYDELNKIKNHLLKLKANQEISTKIQLFDHNSMINDYLPQENIKGLIFKFLITFPRVKVPEIENVPSEQPLIQFTIKQIQNRAEAPWMQKDENGVIFTNKIQIFEHLKLYTEIEENNEQNPANKTSKQRMKQQLQLDTEVLNKLQKLTKNRKNGKSAPQSQVV